MKKSLSPERRAQAVDDARFKRVMTIVDDAINNMFDCDTRKYLEEVLRPKLEAVAPTHGVSHLELGLERRHKAEQSKAVDTAWRKTA